MGMEQMPKGAWDLIDLARCALEGKKVSEQRVQAMDLDSVFSLAQFHSLEALVSFAPEVLLCSWKEAQEKSLRKNLLLDMERRRLSDWMTQNGIWHMSLKGSVLKDLYPRMEMRQMSDLDILYDRQHQTAVRRYMLEQGYTTEGFRDTHHDVFCKPPLYTIELHHTLFERCCDLKLVEYYRDVKHRLLPDVPGSMCHHFSDEDFYIYMIAHAYKHHQDKGVGIRALVDVWVYERSKGDGLDWSYIARECDRLGIGAYENQCRTLARKLFSGEQLEGLTEQEQEMLLFSLRAGTHGTENCEICHKLKTLQGGEGTVTGATKVRYLLKRLFPDLQWMKQKSRMVRKFPWTLPLAWTVRLCRGVFVRGTHTAAEFRYVMDREEI